jgi:hypothetical protein
VAGRPRALLVLALILAWGRTALAENQAAGHEGLAETSSVADSPPTPTPRSQRLRETEGPPPAKPPTLLPWILVGSGVLAISSGAIVGGFALARHNDALSDPSQIRAAGLQADSENLSRVSNLCFVGGTILAAAGALWWLLE